MTTCTAIFAYELKNNTRRKKNPHFLCIDEFDEYACKLNSCKNNGLCLMIDQEATCFCEAGFTGELCETLISKLPIIAK
jgi:hypothetical protein